MFSFSGRPVRRAALVAGAVTSVFTMAGCSGDDAPDPQATPTGATLHSLGELPGLTVVDTRWDAYRTATITKVAGRPDSRVVDVTYEGSEATCQGIAGYAEDRDGKQVRITLVLGHEDGCDPGEPVPTTTSLRLVKALGEGEPVVSEYSETSIDIG